jgi:hypothetical protein
MTDPSPSPGDSANLARLRHVLDRQDILDCLTRFSRGMDRFDESLFLSAFHDDAVISAGDFVGGARDLYGWACDMHARGQASTSHSLLNHTCDIAGEIAHTETYYLFAARNKNETNWIAGGRYLDRLEQREGAWKIALRCNVIEWSGLVATLPIPFAEVADIHANGPPSRSRRDPSYLRPLVNRRRLRVPA